MNDKFEITNLMIGLYMSIIHLTVASMWIPAKLLELELGHGFH